MANVNITKKAIQNAFLELLSEKTLQKITVKDITDRCGINRNTFYYHYQDVPALLEEICLIRFEDIVREYPAPSSLEECLDATMKSALESRQIIMNIYHSNNRSTYTNSLWRVCENIITVYIDTVFSDSPISEEDRQLLIRFHKCEAFGLILDWINLGMTDDYIDGVKRMLRLRGNITEEIIRRSSEIL